MANYAHPEVLVNTDWVSAHANDPKVRVVEVDVDTKAYDEGHVPGALANPEVPVPEQRVGVGVRDVRRAMEGDGVHRESAEG